ncbi:hypothetical protein AJ79_05303 [Helicocarpus griseus UAMH5409]|uniref:Xylanolytic transcriptional activator regulatory domain-containing protein n=1 Tax=Helicocarpus griseus UAMH5409 TaxID=1447875 RepID=A0A2B7XPZ5_9EURO|nr:hypothetical protein AJ79_05303 [Helicocarpus griseus UAMH5409]
MKPPPNDVIKKIGPKPHVTSAKSAVAGRPASRAHQTISPKAFGELNGQYYYMNQYISPGVMRETPLFFYLSFVFRRLKLVWTINRQRRPLAYMPLIPAAPAPTGLNDVRLVTNAARKSLDVKETDSRDLGNSSLPLSAATNLGSSQTSPVQMERSSQYALSPDPYTRSQSEPALYVDPLIDSFTPSRVGSSQRSVPQTIQTIDLLNGYSYQVIGVSGELDPWLLRHSKFDDRGFLNFHHVHIRNAGGVPLDEKVPVHFLVTDDRLYDSAKKSTTRQSSDRNIREEVNGLVPLECGQRLIALYFKFIFPVFPIISRSRLGLTQTCAIPDQTVLQEMPIHLLAAIYASAQLFAKYDDYLSVLYAYSKPPTEQLWSLVLEIILSEIHTPHMSTLQAGLLYLNRPAEDFGSTVADSGMVWSLVGMFVGLATSLGLQLECRPMGFPNWERRLRRRLWWAIYAEDKWRGLLMGRPPYIRNDEWDVTNLGDNDFLTDGIFQTPETLSQQEIQCARPFQHFVRLTRIADEVQQKLYSLRAAQRLSQDFPETLEVARPLLHRLKEWYGMLPISLKQRGRPTMAVEESLYQSNCLQFGYVVLEVFVFRALLRPMVLSSAPPPLLEECEDFASFVNLVNECAFEIPGVDDGEPILAVDILDEHGAGNTVLKAAENCAAKALGIVMRMTNYNLSEFWFYWSRIGFAAISNFMMLLLVQAPTKDHAVRAKRLVYLWRQTLRTQSQGCELMNLALVRLDGLLSTGLGRNFHLPKHVKEALDESNQ